MALDDTITELKERFDPLTYDRPVELVYAARQRQQTRRRLSLAVTTTMAVVALVVVWAPFADEQAAIAGWTPEPQTADPALVSAADSMCRPMLSRDLPDLGIPGWSDLRGNGLIVAYPTDTAIGVCMQTDLGRGYAAEGAAAVAVDFEPLTGALRVDGVAGLDRSASGVTVVAGQASTEVARIVVSAPGWTADASIHDRFWLAWWPTTTDASNITVAGYNHAGDLVGSWSPN